MSDFLDFVRLIVEGNSDEVARRLRTNPGLATVAMPSRSARQATTDIFLPEIAHYIYEGDTALHIAAAAHALPVAESLIAAGARVRARNRRGAEPLHYASDANGADPSNQAEMIAFLLQAGAIPTAVDKSGVAPLHRAVRKRSTDAVRALLDGGADVRQPNGTGSTPLHLAVQNTGSGGSGSDEAHLAQSAIIRLLLARGASASDADAKGKTVLAAATSAWVRELMQEDRG